MRNIESCMIKPSDAKRYTAYSNYKKIDFYGCWDKFSNKDIYGFINRYGITFEDHVGCWMLNNNELFY